MNRPLLLALSLLAALGGCHRKKAHGPATTPSEPGMAVEARKLDLSGSVKAIEFVLKGNACKSVRAELLRITADGVVPLNQHQFSSLPALFQGSLWLTLQNGEPFGKRDEKYFSLGAGSFGGATLSNSAAPELFRGTDSVTAEFLHPLSSLEPGRDYVVFARCMSQKKDGHAFESGTVQAMEKHAAETKDELAVVTIRWDK